MSRVLIGTNEKLARLGCRDHLERTVRHALRERRDDIPMLLEHFMLLAASRYDRPAPRLPQAQLRQLMVRDWPGNVRELRNVADRCVLGIAAGAPPFSDEPPAGPRPLAATVEYFDRALIAAALGRHAGSLARTAEALGMAKTTLHDKIRKYRLAQPD